MIGAALIDQRRKALPDGLAVSTDCNFVDQLLLTIWRAIVLARPPASSRILVIVACVNSARVSSRRGLV